MCFPLGDLFLAQNISKTSSWNNFDDDKNKKIFSNKAINV